MAGQDIESFLLNSGGPAEPAGPSAEPDLEWLTPERQADVLKVAMRFSIRQDDPLFAIILALQYHLDLYDDIPAKVREAINDAATQLNTCRNGFTEDAEKARESLAFDFKKFLDSARPMLTTAAQKGVNDAIGSLDTGKLVAEVAGKVADAVAITKARKLAGLGLALAGAAFISALVAGALLGRYAFPQQDPAAQRAAAIMRQLDCRTSRPGEIVCINPANRTGVTLQLPAEYGGQR